MLFYSQQMNHKYKLMAHNIQQNKETIICCD